MSRNEKCNYSRKLNAYIDGELKEKEFTKVRDHLKNCHFCQNELREINRISGFLSQYKDEDVPEKINQQILDAVKIFPKRNLLNFLPGKLVKLSIAASVILAFLSGIVLSNIAFASTNDSTIEFGQETLFSMYYEGE